MSNFESACEEFMLRKIKKSIDRGLSALLKDFKNKENLSPVWKIKALRVCLRTKKRIMCYRNDLLRTNLVDLETFNRKCLLINEIQQKLEIVSTFHYRI